MTQKGDDDRYHVCITIPVKVYIPLMEAIGIRAMRLVGEHHPKRNKVVSHAEDVRAAEQAMQEALKEAIQDWLAKPKDEKWL